MNKSTQREFKGSNGTLILTETGITIKRGIKGFLFGGMMLRGDKTIPYSSIVAVQLKKAGLLAGYLQLTLSGGSEAKSGLIQSTDDENSINFNNWGDNNAQFAEAKSLIEQRIHAADSVSTAHSNLDELEKLARLKEKGIISDKEFQAKKKQLLDS